MNNDRLKISEFLHSFSSNVYYQPTQNTHLTYPCFLYEPNDIQNWHADNVGYVQHTGFSVTFITTDKDSDIPNKVMATWPMAQFNTYFVNDNLYHTVVILYV